MKKTSVIVLGENHTDRKMRDVLIQLQNILNQQQKSYLIGYEGLTEESYPVELQKAINNAHSNLQNDRSKKDNTFFKYNDYYLNSSSKKVFRIDDKMRAYDQQKNNIFINMAGILGFNKYFLANTNNAGLRIRDQTMAQNTISCIEKKEPDIIILLCGADHIKGICDELQKQNIVYTSVAPYLEGVNSNFKIKNINQNSTQDDIYNISGKILGTHNSKVERGVNNYCKR
jgi:hypothetical protein